MTRLLNLSEHMSWIEHYKYFMLHVSYYVGKEPGTQSPIPASSLAYTGTSCTPEITWIRHQRVRPPHLFWFSKKLITTNLTDRGPVEFPLGDCFKTDCPRAECHRVDSPRGETLIFAHFIRLAVEYRHMLPVGSDNSDLLRGVCATSRA